jgi:endonuclease-3
MVTNRTIATVMRILREVAPSWSAPVVSQMASLSRDPYLVLIACLLSLRTKDETTGPAARRLFALADTPEKMLRLTPAQIERAIYPVGFYKTKAQTVLAISRVLVENYSGRVPNEITNRYTLSRIHVGRLLDRMYQSGA